MQRRGAKSLADDLVTGRGVVLSRAATTLRSVETYPPIGRFVVFHFSTKSAGVNSIWDLGESGLCKERGLIGGALMGKRRSLREEAS